MIEKIQLSIKEGGSWSDFVVTAYKINGKWEFVKGVKPSETPSELLTIHYIVDVVGMKDDIAPSEDWGEQLETRVIKK